MNRLIIVGNGFDLAHGLPTSYKDFIETFWLNLDKNWNDKWTTRLIYIHPSSNWNQFLKKNFKNFGEFESVLSNENGNPIFPIYYRESNKTAYNKNNVKEKVFEFKNDFFRKINIKSIENWVDIENEYYLELKKNSKRRNLNHTGNLEEINEEQLEENKKSVQKLNSEFEQIKVLFIRYLNDYVEEALTFDKEPDSAFSLLKYFKTDYLDLKNNPNSDFLNEFPKEDHDDLIKADSDYKEHINSDPFFYGTVKFNHPHSVFLNFNYTSSVTYYNWRIFNDKKGYAQIIHIHGSLKEGEKSINFGFGDEMDKDYRFIESLNENEYLQNFKSFMYTQNSNYKKTLDFLDSNKYQVFVLGHSCGLSDRTLLNTIFEHDNCRSIKVFYYKREDGSDNFTEIIQNISRHFNNKKEMRAKLVNKSLCKPLPQNIRFQKKN